MRRPPVRHPGGWIMAYAQAAYEAGWTLPPWLLMAVQMQRYGGGCASCGSVGR